MEKGFNSDVIYRGMNFHVQTEDWGFDNPFLVSRIYQNGAVIKSLKTPYAEVLGQGSSRGHGFGLGRSLISRHNVDPQALRLAMRDQHQRILDLLVGGQLF